MNVNISGGPLSALTCCVNARLLSAIKKNIAVNLFSKLGWELGLYYARIAHILCDVCTSQRTSPGLPTPSLSPRRHNSAYTFSAGWKEQVSLHPSSPPSTGVPLRACWPAASLSGTETAVQQTARPSSGQWTPLQKSLVPLSPPSWTFSLHDAPAKQKVSWRTPPTPPTVSSSSYPQVDGTGVSEPAPPDCSTAFSPRLWEPWTHITPPLSETPNNTPPPPPTLPHLRKKLLNFYLCGIQVSGPAQATCSNTCSNTHMH